MVKARKKAEILERLRCIEGHVRGVERMASSGKDYTDVLFQIRALQGSMKKVKALLVEEYLLTAYFLPLMKTPEAILRDEELALRTVELLRRIEPQRNRELTQSIKVG